MRVSSGWFQVAIAAVFLCAASPAFAENDGVAVEPSPQAAESPVREPIRSAGGQIVSDVDPVGGVVHSIFGADGQLIEQRAADGHVIQSMPRDADHTSAPRSATESRE